MKQRSILVIAAAGLVIAGALVVVYQHKNATTGPSPVAGSPLDDLSVAEPPAKQTFHPDHAQIRAVLALPPVAAPLDPRWRSFLLGHVREGLVRLDAQGHPEPGAAASWEVVDAHELRFKLRPGLKWSDGSALTPAQFVSAWARRIKGKAAADLGAFAALDQAAAVAAGTAQPDALGAHADGDEALIVKLAAAAPPPAQVLQAMADPLWAPLAIDGEPGAAELAAPFNGPFTPARGGDGFVLTRNANYWGVENVGLEQVAALPAPADRRRLVDDFLAGTVAYAEGLGTDPELLNRAGGYVHRALTGGAVVMVLNRKAPELKSANFRRGLRVAINRRDLELYTAKDGGIAAMRGLIPPLLPGIFANYGAEYGVVYDTNPRLAEAYFAKARKDTRFKSAKTLAVLAADVPAAHAELEHLTAWLAANHQLTLKPTYVAAAALPAALAKGEFTIAYLRLDPHSSDPLAYLEQFRAAPLANVVQLSAAARAKLDAAAKQTDVRQRFNAVAEAERQMYTDDYLIGIAQEAAPYLIDAKLNGVTRNLRGADPDFTRARATEAVAASATKATSTTP